jgi:uncharacterized protein
MRIIIAFILLFLSASQAVAQAVSGVPFIAVRGHAEREVIPDEFAVEIVLTETSFDSAKTQKKIEDLAALALQLAKKYQLSDADISISNLSIDAEEKYNEKTDQDVFVGNSYTREIDLVFKSLKDLKAFVSEFPSGKEVKVSTSVFTSSKEREVRNELIKLAVQDAKADADALAQSVGKKIIGVQNISNAAGITGYSNYSNLEAVEVTGSRTTGFHRSADIVITEGVTTIKQDVYVIYLLGQ